MSVLPKELNLEEVSVTVNINYIYNSKNKSQVFEYLKHEFIHIQHYIYFKTANNCKELKKELITYQIILIMKILV